MPGSDRTDTKNQDQRAGHDLSHQQGSVAGESVRGHGSGKIALSEYLELEQVPDEKDAVAGAIEEPAGHDEICGLRSNGSRRAGAGRGLQSAKVNAAQRMRGMVGGGPENAVQQNPQRYPQTVQFE